MANGLTESNDLIVEDGTGIDDANSYAARATIDEYVNLRQDAVLANWSIADESNQVAALIIATQYLDIRWCYKSSITNLGTDIILPQALQWPRLLLVDSRGVTIESDEIPTYIIDGLAEYASRAIDPVTFEARALLVDSVTQDPSGRFIKETFEQVGPLRELIKYSESKATRKIADYGNADRILRNSGLVVLGAGSMAIRG